MAFNERFIFEELDSKNIVEISGKTYVSFPIEGPAMLEMRLSPRQLEKLSREIVNSKMENGIYKIVLEGRTRFQTPPQKKCICETQVLMVSGCKCGGFATEKSE